MTHTHQCTRNVSYSHCGHGWHTTQAPAPSRRHRTPFASVTAQAPAYLDEEDEQSYFGTGVMTRNMGSSSLEARLAARRKEQAEKDSRRGGKRAAVASMFGRLGTTFGLW